MLQEGHEHQATGAVGRLGGRCGDARPVRVELDLAHGQPDAGRRRVEPDPERDPRRRAARAACPRGWCAAAPRRRPCSACTQGPRRTNPAAYVLDSKPLVANVDDYCDKVGFGDWKFCDTRRRATPSARPATTSSPARRRTPAAGGRPGSTASDLCAYSPGSCANHPTEQFMAIAKDEGQFEACAAEGWPVAPERHALRHDRDQVAGWKTLSGRGAGPGSTSAAGTGTASRGARPAGPAPRGRRTPPTWAFRTVCSGPGGTSVRLLHRKRPHAGAPAKPALRAPASRAGAPRRVLGARR